MSPLQITHKYPNYHLATVTTGASQNSPVALTIFFGYLPKWLVQTISLQTTARNALYLAEGWYLLSILPSWSFWIVCPYRTSSSTLFISYVFPATIWFSWYHRGLVVIWIPLSFILSPLTKKKKKKTTHLVLAENGLISTSRDQEKDEKDKHVCTVGHVAWLLLLWTMFWVVLNHKPPF